MQSSPMPGSKVEGIAANHPEMSTDHPVGHVLLAGTNRGTIKPTLACCIMAKARAASAARSRVHTRILTFSAVVVPFSSNEESESTSANASQYVLAL